MRQIFLGILGWGQVTHGWEDDNARRQDNRRRRGRWDIGWQEGRYGQVNKCT